MDRSKRPTVKFLAEYGLAFLLLLIAGLASYWTVRHGTFLYDDTWLVGGNPFFKSPIFVFEVFRHYLFLDSLSFYYRPVQNISYMLDYWLWYSDPLGYHLANIFYHVLAAFLLYLLLKILLPGLAGAGDWRAADAQPAANSLLAFLVALLWVVHPIHNAAVAYVAGRADSLACDFTLGAWLLYIGAGRCRGLWGKAPLYLLAAFCLLLGLCSKEIAMVWLPLFLVHLFFFNKERPLPGKFATVLGLLAVMGCYYCLHRLPGGAAVPVSAGSDSFYLRTIKMLRALGDYTWLVFYPDNLHMDRFVLPPGTTPAFFQWNFHNRLECLAAIGMAMIAVFLLMGISRLPGQRLRLFAIVWFLSGFLPVSNLFPLNAQVAEHWIYMPSMGLLLFFAGCVLALPKRVHAFAAAIALLAVVPLAWRTSKRAAEWADPQTFFLQTIQSGGGTTRINLNLAMVFYNAGDYAKAEALMRDIVKHFPDYIPAKLDLGMTLVKEGKVKEAEPYLNFDKQSTAENSTKFANTWTAGVSIAGLRLKEKNYDAALAQVDDTLKQFPGVWGVIQFKANVLQSMGRIPDAIACVKDYTGAHWWQYDSFINLGQLYRLNQDAPAAIAAYQHAALLDIHAAEPYFRIAEIDDNLLHRPDDAQEARISGLTRNPDLTKILNALDKKEDAIKAVQHAEELRHSAAMPADGG